MGNRFRMTTKLEIRLMCNRYFIREYKISSIFKLESIIEIFIELGTLNLSFLNSVIKTYPKH